MADLFVICPITARMRDRLSSHFSIQHIDDLDAPLEWLQGNGAGVDYVLTDGHLGVPPELMAALPGLKAISSYGVGYDAIDTAEAVHRGIPVSHTPDVLNMEVATTALMLYLACFRDFPAQVEQARSGRWERDGALPLARSADNRTIGILGLGRIGKVVADKLMPFQPTILYTGRSKQDVPYTYFDDLTEMARAAAVLICVAPGGAATRHLVNAEVIDALGPRGTLINVGRGSVVDEQALISALQDGRLGWAGLDVFADEPHIPEALRTNPRVVVTPHIGSATVETRAAMGDLAVDNLLAHRREGTLLTPVPECAHLVNRSG